jgi:outer membrane biosynthesis protein TonB
MKALREIIDTMPMMYANHEKPGEKPQNPDKEKPITEPKRENPPVKTPEKPITEPDKEKPTVPNREVPIKEPDKEQPAKEPGTDDPIKLPNGRLVNLSSAFQLPVLSS